MRKVTMYDVYSHLGAKGYLNWIPDEIYLKIQYRLKMHRKLHLDDPKTMNEKLQWLKIHNRNPFYTELVDKYTVRKHIEKAVDNDILIPLLGVWNEPEEIDFFTLPDRFVLKCNHDSGGVIVCKDKASLDIQAATRKLKANLKRNYSWGNREWPYKNIKPKIIAEEYIEDHSGQPGLTDYKFYCFNGEPDCVLACVDRKPGYAKFIFFDRNWKRLDYNNQSKEEETRIVPKPENLDEMFKTAEIIAQYVNSPFLRVDLYNVDGKTYFGEITFYPHSGMDTTLKLDSDIKFGDKISF